MRAFTAPSQLCPGLRMDQALQGVESDPQTHPLAGVTKSRRCDSAQELRGHPRSLLIPAGSSVSTQRDWHCQGVLGGQCPGLGQVWGFHGWAPELRSLLLAAPVLRLLHRPGFASPSLPEGFGGFPGGLTGISLPRGQMPG